MDEDLKQKLLAVSSLGLYGIMFLHGQLENHFPESPFEFIDLNSRIIVGASHSTISVSVIPHYSYEI